ncbi:MAG: hypothetical protein V1492_00155 [Candidatus Micrarchaeota archaeon]
MEAVIRMWDENLLILKVDKKLEAVIKKDDFVLADYTPISDKSPYRKLLITKIIPKEKAMPIWNEFKEELEKKKDQGQRKMAQPSPYIR